MTPPKGSGTDWLRLQMRRTATGPVLDVSEAQASQIEVEHWLQGHKVEYTGPVQIAMAMIDEKRSRQNQARKDPLVTDSVDRYAQAFRDGAVFPPIVVYPAAGKLVIVDGNNRQAGAKRAGREFVSGFIISETTPSELIQLMTVEANGRHGVTPDVTWRVRQALHLTTLGIPDAKAASAASVSVPQIRTARGMQEADARARELRINGFGDLPGTSRQALGVLKDQAVFYQAAKTVINTGMSIEDIRQMIRAVKGCTSEADRLSVVTKIANDREIEAQTKRATGRTMKRVGSPKTSLITGIGQIMSVKEDELCRAIVTAHDRDLINNRLTSLVDKILAVQVAMEANLGHLSEEAE